MWFNLCGAHICVIQLTCIMCLPMLGQWPGFHSCWSDMCCLIDCVVYIDIFCKWPIQQCILECDMVWWFYSEGDEWYKWFASSKGGPYMSITWRLASIGTNIFINFLSTIWNSLTARILGFLQIFKNPPMRVFISFPFFFLMTLIWI